ncbi:MAG TPA: PIG-L family deacetylase [Reyranella sp.]|jgi:LmbE family N-acetylglucosaminyl deacetylase|nr:PIG-L family deacetylase [Reyranella sp.]
MKLRLYFRPGPVVLLLAIAAALLWWLVHAVSLWFLPIALAYSALLAISAWAWWRSHVLERELIWRAPRRLLILAPHEDDCVIAAGGVGALNRRLGGDVRVVYLAPDETPGMAQTRAEEARAAWREAGVDASELHHFDLLPSLLQRDPKRLHAAARELRRIIDDFKPTTVVVPMFEGGHVHHDMVAATLDYVISDADTFEVFEAPEYGPCVSLNYTPHRVIALCARWLLGLVSYCGPADGVDDRPILRVRLEPADLDCKKRMLAAFRSQNAPSLVATRAYPDRLVRWQRREDRRHPFGAQNSYLRLARTVDRILPRRLAARLLPGQRGTIGRPGKLTDWREEWGA